MNKKLSKRPPSGFRDLSPTDCLKRERIIDTLKAVFKQHGYRPLETPCIERYEVLHGKYGEEGDKLIYDVLNSGEYHKNLSPEDLQGSASTLTPKLSKRALRYDHTLPLARYVAANRSHLVFPARFYQMGPVWRADRPQKGRYREFWQCDADIIAPTRRLPDQVTESHVSIFAISIVPMIRRIFTRLGLYDQVVIEYNDRRTLRRILTEEVPSVTNSDFQLFLSLLDDIEKVGKEEVLSKIKQKNWLTEVIEKIIKNPYRPLGVFGDERIRWNFNLARGLDYYTGAVYEVKWKEDRSVTLAAGGEYGKLTEFFGETGLTGVGVSLGLDRMMNFLPQVEEHDIHVMLVNVYETYLGPDIHDYFRFQDALFDEGLSVVVANFIDERAALGYARKKGISFVILRGEKRGKLVMRRAQGQQKGEELDTRNTSPKNLAQKIADKVKRQKKDYLANK